MAPALPLFGLLAGTVTFWLSPLAHFRSRRFEYEADAQAGIDLRWGRRYNTGQRNEWSRLTPARPGQG